MFVKSASFWRFFGATQCFVQNKNHAGKMGPKAFESPFCGFVQELTGVAIQIINVSVKIHRNFSGPFQILSNGCRQTLLPQTRVRLELRERLIKLVKECIQV